MVSSAKHNIFKLEQLFISFTYIKNKIGPKVEPYGTPVLLFRYVDFCPKYFSVLKTVC